MGNPSLVFALIVAGLLLTIAIVLGIVAGLIWLVIKLIMGIAVLIGAVLSGSMIALLTVVLIVLAAALLYWFIFLVHRLPLVLIGLGNLTSIPAVPFSLSELPGTVLRLATRASQTEQAKEGLSTELTIAGRKADDYTFMFGTATDSSFTRLTLETPEQFAMGWTTFGGVERDAEHLLPELAATLRDKEAATRAFWPTIAKFSVVFNAIILETVTPARRDAIKSTHGGAWTDEMETLHAAGGLYIIDMTFFAKFPPATVDGFPRFTPSTLTFLKREGDGIVPFAIRVSKQNDADARMFVPSDRAWLYALQAAKASITVWGIWIGHVHHWHIVTAAMQMTMFQTFGGRHIVRQLLARQSKYLIAFDQFLLLAWRIAPPTSLDSSMKFLQMMDAYAANRTFAADDPRTAIAALGLRKEDFSRQADWDQYPVVRYLLALWEAAERYVGTVVDANYAGDDDVRRDAEVASWIRASGDPARGNVNGLPPMDGKAALKGVLTSLIFRVTAHGCSRLNQVANPMLSFAANFPPCLQVAEIPPADAEMDVPHLMPYLPRTGTIGALINFLFTFLYSPPYESFIPLAGADADLTFTGPTADACNKALHQFRLDLEAFMELWADDAHVQGPPAQIHQWELNIET
jgi:hypothetical protein